MKRIVMVVVIALIVSTVMSASAWAQSTATIRGSVKDMTGAVLPGVEVKVTQTKTSVAGTTVTNETGSYVLPNLPLGPYRLEAARPGFGTFVFTCSTRPGSTQPLVECELLI